MFGVPSLLFWVRVEAQTAKAQEPELGSWEGAASPLIAS